MLTEQAVATAALNWFSATWDPNMSLVQWREQLVDSGWAVPSWSDAWFGQGLPAWAERVAHRAIREAGGVAVPLGVGMGLAAPTMYDHAADPVKRKYLRRTLTGEITWCQLFSEPGAGSDLAGLRCTAVRDGEEWVINGQKVWNTMAHRADMGILVARTNWDVPKHAGITYFLVDMHQPGIEVRQILEMNYHDSFNEVFLSDARVPADDVVGGVNSGWKVARGTLAHERSFASIGSVYFAPTASGRVVAEAKIEAAEFNKTYEWYPQRMGRADLTIPSAQARGVSADPVLRQELMKLHSFYRASEWTAERAKAARALGKPPGSEGSIGKLALSRIAHTANHVHSMISGAQGMLRTGDDPLDAVIAEVLVSTPAQSIAGGTDEIQRNILGENVLGLPKEPAPDRSIAFKDVGKS